MGTGNLSKKKGFLSELTNRELDYIAERVITSTPYIGDNGNWYAYNVLEKRYVDTGVKAKAEDGYTPIRGTDYWTDEDIAEIKSYVDEAILGGAW